MKLKLKKGKKVYINGVDEVEVLWFNADLIQVLYSGSMSRTLIRKNFAITNKKTDNINVEPVKVGFFRRLLRA